MALSISNALPIQFWLNGQQVFNDTDEPGIERTSFLQKFEAGDDVVLQVIDTIARDYKLRIVDLDDVEIDLLQFTMQEVDGIYVYSLSYTFEDSSVLNQVVKVKILYLEDQMAIAITDLSDAIVSDITNSGSGVTMVIEDLEDTITSDILTGVIRSGSYKISHNTASICASSPQTTYWMGGVTPTIGDQLYENSSLSAHEASGDYIVIGSIIYELNDGVVGADTGLTC